MLGSHVKQAGSLVALDRLRFDFGHFAALTRDELDEIEQLANEHIYANRPVQTEIRSTREAMAAGAMALFGEKYGDRVRVVSVPGFSMELCGGTHCRATGDIGAFVIVQESGIAAGVRRIEALTARARCGTFSTGAPPGPPPPGPQHAGGPGARRRRTAAEQTRSGLHARSATSR